MESSPEPPRLCLICATDISAKRRQAIYCGDRCGKRAQRAGVAKSKLPRGEVERITPEAAPKRLRKPGVNDLAQMIVSAQSLEQSFRFASVKADHRFRPMCARIADALHASLEQEGL